MALRTFRSNPSIGGFGSETTGGGGGGGGGIGLYHGQYDDDDDRSSLSDHHDDDNGRRERPTDDDDQASSIATVSSSSAGGGPSSQPSSSSSHAEVNKSSNRRRRTTTPVAAAAAVDDAFAQIVKELVDNAVDACHAASAAGNHDVLRRVRVVFETVPSPTTAVGNEVLRVTVSDNGVGMSDMAGCVSAFHTSKGDATAAAATNEPERKTDPKRSSRKGGRPGRGRRGGSESSSSNSRKSLPPSESEASSSSQQRQQSYTAGRYGVGLTLCLLHAQRLVPDSCASIASSTIDRPYWERCRFVVDADRDLVRCVSRVELPKKIEAKESGTSVSLLVPGGHAARRAWPRLAEYFARFHLSMTTTNGHRGGGGSSSPSSPSPTRCSLEVLAPMLATAPLFVRPPREMKTMVREDDDDRVVVDAEPDGVGGEVGSTMGADDGGGEVAETAKTSGVGGVKAMDVSSDDGAGACDGEPSSDVHHRVVGGDGGDDGDDSAADAGEWTDGMVPEEEEGSKIYMGGGGVSSSSSRGGGGNITVATDATPRNSASEGEGSGESDHQRGAVPPDGGRDDDDSVPPPPWEESTSDLRSGGGTKTVGHHRRRGDDADRVDERRSIQKAAEAYLRRPIELRNVACSVQPIRRPGMTSPNDDGAGASACDGLFDRDGGLSTGVVGGGKRRRRDGRSGSTQNSSSKNAPVLDETPMLEVNVIAYGPDQDCDDDDAAEPFYRGQDGSDMDDGYEGRNATHPGTTSGIHPSTETAKLMLVRMVNRIPLLDGAEAQACGMVRGIASKHETWNSFGLDVSMMTPPTNPSSNDCLDTMDPPPRTTRRGKRRAGAGGGNGREGTTSSTASVDSSLRLHIPMFTVNDSIQVAPFFQSNTHSLFQGPNDTDDGNDSEDGQDSIFRELQEECQSESEDEACSHGRSRRRRGRRLLPAGLRIGNLLIVTHIHAKPSALPLPTLSKGRLPMGDAALDTALELGLLSCLRSLQRTNPDLLLTAHQLKQTERDSRHVPAIAAGIASIVCNSRDDDFRARAGGMITKWNSNDDDRIKDSNLTLTVPTGSSPHSVIHGSCQLATPDEASRTTEFNVSSLGPLLEERLRLVLSTSSKGQKSREGRGRSNSAASSDDGHCGDSYCGSLASEEDRIDESNKCNDGDHPRKETPTCSGNDSDYDSMGMDEAEPSETLSACRNDAGEVSVDYGGSKQIGLEHSQVCGETSSSRVDDSFSDNDEWW